jgi:hypothetical protein
MRRAAVILILVIGALLVLPIPWPGDTGAYNTLSGMSWCIDAQSCTHERGHALDQRRGWPSQSEDFAFETRVYVVSQMRSDMPERMAGVILAAWAHPVSRIGTNPNAELYAQIYQAANGNIDEIPSGLRKFYGGNP